MTDSDENWLTREPDSLSRLARNNSSTYERRVRQITDISPKIEAIDMLCKRYAIGVDGNTMVLHCISTTDAGIPVYIIPEVAMACKLGDCGRLDQLKILSVDQTLLCIVVDFALTRTCLFTFSLPFK